MQLVSFLTFMTGAGRSEKVAFANRGVLASDRGLTLTAQFWAEDASAHRVDAVDEPADGPARIVAARTVAADRPGLLTVELVLPPLGRTGRHGLHLDVDGGRVTRHPIGVTVREAKDRIRRARYKGRAASST